MILLFLFDNRLPQSCFYPPEPVFVQIQQIPDSAEKNDDKLYFFFREKSLDSSGGASPSVLARVGRVCLVSQTNIYIYICSLPCNKWHFKRIEP